MMKKERFIFSPDFLYIVRSLNIGTRAVGDILYSVCLYELQGEEYLHSDERVDLFLELWKRCFSKRYAEEENEFEPPVPP